MATTDVNSIPDPQDAIIEMAQINIDSIEAPQAPNEIMNGSSTQSREKGSLQLKTCLELHKAALKGDWETAKYLLEQGPRSILSASITTGNQTVLHIATAAKKTNFVKELVNRMEQEELALKDKNGNTAFCFAAAAGVVEIAKIILTKNSSLMTIRGAENVTPLYMAALFAQRDMASFLYGKDDTKKALTVEDRKAIFFTYIRTDLALNLLKDHPELAVARDMNCDTALHVLARMPSTFARKDRGLLEGLISSFPGMKFMTHNKDSKSNQALQLVSCLWEEILKRDDLELTSLLGKPSQLSFDAAKLGNFEFLAELIGCYPDLACELDNNNHTIFHVAVLHRHVKIFNLIYHTAFAKELMVTFEDNKQNNILHLAAKYPHSSQVTNVSGAALQMQKELLWFKEAGQIVQPSFREKKNSESKTPQEIFSVEHERLLRSGELWMKKTVESCMLVATLITTIMFATALSVLGGNDNNIGIPIRVRDTLFQVFALSNAISLSSSSISILVFLSILKSRYTENDFLWSLPLKLMVGLSTLFISMITMMVTFSTTFFLAYHDRLNWVTMLTTVLASVPVTIFVLLKYPLLKDIFCSTYHSRSLYI